MKTERPTLFNFFENIRISLIGEKHITKEHHNSEVILYAGEPLVIELESAVDGHQWIPTDKSLTHFENFQFKPKTTRSNKKITCIKLRPQTIGKGIFTLNYLNPINPREVLNFFCIKYAIINRPKNLSILPPGQYPTS